MVDTTKRWPVSYGEFSNGTRVLINLPTDMYRDVRVLSGAFGCSRSEFMRRAITAHVALTLEQHPEWAKSIRAEAKPLEAKPVWTLPVKKSPVVKKKVVRRKRVVRPSTGETG